MRMMIMYHVVGTQRKFLLRLAEGESCYVTEFQKTQPSSAGLDSSYTYMDLIPFMIWWLARLEASFSF